MRALKMKTRATRKGGQFFFVVRRKRFERKLFLREKKTEREELYERNFAFFLNFVFFFGQRAE